VVLEAVAPAIPGVNYPRLVEGARRGPPEDVGGPWGYGEFLQAIVDPKHERHTELLEWCGGGFDPQQFDIDEINRRLASLAPHLGFPGLHAWPQLDPTSAFVQVSVPGLTTCCDAASCQLSGVHRSCCGRRRARVLGPKQATRRSIEVC
jgi:hypothetical protein